MIAARLIALLAIAFCLLLPGAGYAETATSPQASGSSNSTADLTFTILHTNDLHAHDSSFMEKGHLVGGIARIASLIKEIRGNTKNVVVVDAGDIFQGTPFFKLYHGQVEVDMLNAAGYDVYTIGNHEFDDGARNLAERLKSAKFDIVSANLDASALPDLAKLVKPSVIKTIDGKKVAFIGGITPRLPEVALNLEGVKVKAMGAEWMQPFKDEAKRLKAEGVDKIVLISHIGVEMEKPLAQEVPELDVIIGGHSHTRLDQPILIQRPDGSSCAIVQAWCYGRMLGKLKVSFDKQGNLILSDLNYHLIPITDSIAEEPAMKAELLKKGKPFRSQERTICGVAMGGFPNHFRNCWSDSAIGDLITDSLVDAGKKYGATIGLQNRGGIRGGIDEGTISQSKVEEVLPFDNRLVFATVKGSVLLKALEHGLCNEFSGGRFLDVSGLKVEYDRKAPADHKLISVKTITPAGKWEDVEPNKLYKIAVNDFTFKGGEGFDFSSATNVFQTQTRLSVFFMNYLVKNKKVTPCPGTRITPVHE